MSLLVDTHILLWALAEPNRIPESTRRRLESAESTVLFSAASIWELAIKVQHRRIELPLDPGGFAAAGGDPVQAGVRATDPVARGHGSGGDPGPARGDNRVWTSIPGGAAPGRAGEARGRAGRMNRGLGQPDHSTYKNAAGEPIA